MMPLIRVTGERREHLQRVFPEEPHQSGPDQASTYRQGARMGMDTRYFFTLLPASCYYLYIFKGEVIFYQNRTLYFTVLGKGC